MNSNNDEWHRSSRSVPLVFVALMVSVVLGAGFLLINSVGASGTDSTEHPLSDDQAAAQVVDSAKQIVDVARLRGATGGYIFMSCKNEDLPPYQAAVYLNFLLPQTNSVKYLREIATAMRAHGWAEAPSMGEHFGKKLTKDGVTSIFYRNVDDANFGTMRLYGECRNMGDHRNDNPAWIELTELLSGTS